MRWIPRLSAAALDSIFLSIVVSATIALYVPGLGFAGDDWQYLAAYTLSADQSARGLLDSVFVPIVWMRPVQQVHSTVLYISFGTDPSGYHISNGVVFLCGILLLHRVLLRLQLGHLVAVSVALIYALLPHYSADRFWIIAYGITLSMPLYLLSLYSDLRAVEVSGPPFWGWRCLGLLSLLASTLTYELFLPLFFLNLLLLAPRGWPQPAPSPLIPSSRRAVLYGNLAALAAVVIFKVATTRRMGIELADAGLYDVYREIRDLGRTLLSLDQAEADYGLNLIRALWVNYGELGLLLPRMAWRAIREEGRPVAVATAALMGPMVFCYLSWLGQRERLVEAGLLPLKKLAVVGFIVFWGGYAIFLTNSNLQITATGIGNRTALAAALGVALSFTAAIAWVSSRFLRARWRRHSYCLLVSLVSLAGLLINDGIASLWKTAYRRQLEILAAIGQDIRDLPPGTALILDGTCPFVGPAIVFESSWDLQGALQLLYRDPSLEANVVTPRMRIEEDALVTSIYGEKSRYRYGKLLVYDFRRRAGRYLSDAREAREYFDETNPDFDSDCPPGHEGVGVDVF